MKGEDAIRNQTDLRLAMGGRDTTDTEKEGEKNPQQAPKAQGTHNGKTNPIFDSENQKGLIGEVLQSMEFNTRNFKNQWLSPGRT